MTNKDQAYRAHLFLEARCVTSVKRSHVHELLAAATGYGIAKRDHALIDVKASWISLVTK